MKVKRFFEFIWGAIWFVLLFFSVIIVRVILSPFWWIELSTFNWAMKRFAIERQAWIAKKEREKMLVETSEECTNPLGCMCIKEYGGPLVTGCMYLNNEEDEKRD